jgi:hypothetical protein
MEEKLFVDEFEGIESMRDRGVLSDPLCLYKFLCYQWRSGDVLGRWEYILGVVGHMLDIGIDVNACNGYGSNALMVSCDFSDVSLTRLLLDRGGLLGGDTAGKGYESLLLSSCDFVTHAYEMGLVDRLRGGDESVVPELVQINFRQIVSACDNRRWGSVQYLVSLSSLIEHGKSTLREVCMRYSLGIDSYADVIKGELRYAVGRHSWSLFYELRAGLVSKYKLDMSVDRYVYCGSLEYPALLVHCNKRRGCYRLTTMGDEPGYGKHHRCLNPRDEFGKIMNYDRVEWVDTSCGRTLIRCYIGAECEEITLIEGYRAEASSVPVWTDEASEFPLPRRIYIRYRGSYCESIASMDRRGVYKNPLSLFDLLRDLRCWRMGGDYVDYILSAIDYLVSRGIDVNALDELGEGVLYRTLSLCHRSAFMGHVRRISDTEASKILSCLLSHGARVDLVRPGYEHWRYNRLLSMCCHNDLLECSRVLLDHGVSVDPWHILDVLDRSRHNGETHVGRLSYQLCMTRMLLEYGSIDMSVVDTKVNSEVSLGGLYMKYVCSFIDVDARGVAGEYSPSFLPLQRELVDLLLSHGASLHTLDASGRSVIDHARLVGNVSLVSYLESLW